MENSEGILNPVLVTFPLMLPALCSTVTVRTSSERSHMGKIVEAHGKWILSTLAEGQRGQTYSYSFKVIGQDA